MSKCVLVLVAVLAALVALHTQTEARSRPSVDAPDADAKGPASYVDVSSLTDTVSPGRH